MREVGQWFAIGQQTQVMKTIIILTIVLVVISMLGLLGYAHSNAAVATVKSMRLEKTKDAQSWTLIYTLHDGSELECRTIEALVVTAEKREGAK